MDPNTCLEELRALYNEVLIKGGLASSDKVTRFAELVEALDEWMSMGGAKPKEWQRNDWIKWATSNIGRGV